MPTFTLPLKDVLYYTDEEIGLDDYPIFDPAYRAPLNQKIINHFWNREIGLETIDMFVFNMRRKMHEIMPLYNPLYETTKLEFDPLSTIDIKTVSEGVTSQKVEAEGESNTTSENTSGSRTASSELPQNMLGGNKDYATSAVDSNSAAEGVANASESNTSEATGEQSTESTVKGYQGVPAELIMRYRSSLLNVDMLVIEELNELFMGIWDNGDTFTRSGGYFL